MIIIANKNIKNNKFLPMLSIIEDDEKKLKKEIKKQLINEILEKPESLKAYKDIAVYKIGTIDENFNIELSKEKRLICSYEGILNDIIDDLTKEKKNDQRLKKIRY